MPVSAQLHAAMKSSCSTPFLSVGLAEPHLELEGTHVQPLSSPKTSAIVATAGRAQMKNGWGWGLCREWLDIPPPSLVNAAPASKNVAASAAPAAPAPAAAPPPAPLSAEAIIKHWGDELIERFGELKAHSGGTIDVIEQTIESMGHDVADALDAALESDNCVWPDRKGQAKAGAGVAAAAAPKGADNGGTASGVYATSSKNAQASAAAAAAAPYAAAAKAATTEQPTTTK